MSGRGHGHATGTKAAEQVGISWCHSDDMDATDPSAPCGHRCPLDQVHPREPNESIAVMRLHVTGRVGENERSG
jgi:hypothetical protein